MPISLFLLAAETVLRKDAIDWRVRLRPVGTVVSIVALCLERLWRESSKSTINITNKSQEASPFPAGDHKAAKNRRKSMKNTRHTQTQMIQKRSTALERSVKYFTVGLQPVSLSITEICIFRQFLLAAMKKDCIAYVDLYLKGAAFTNDNSTPFHLSHILKITQQTTRLVTEANSR